MGYLFRQVWLWNLLSFLLGSLLTWAIMRATRRPTVEVSEERIAGPALSNRSSTVAAGTSRVATDTVRGVADAGRSGLAAGAAGAAGAAAGLGAAAAGAKNEAQSWTSTGSPQPSKSYPAGSTKRVAEPGPYAGSVRSSLSGDAPSSEYVIKGNENSMLYHTPDSASYRETKAELWFKTAADAEAAGFRPVTKARKN